MKIEYVKDAVVITIPYKKGDAGKAELSSSGKSRMVATTKSFVEVPGAPDPLKLQVNMISPIPRGERG